MAKVRIEQNPQDGKFIVINDDTGQRTAYATREEAQNAVTVQSQDKPTDEGGDRTRRDR